MPGGDRTGPSGMGPRTGRALGFCNGYNSPGFLNAGVGRMFFGRGRGLGRAAGWRRAQAYQQAAQPTREQEKQALENEISSIEQEKKSLEQEMESIKMRLEQLGKDE